MVIIVVDLDAVDKDVVYVVKMYGDDDDLKVGSKKGIMELIGGMLVSDLVGCVGVDEVDNDVVCVVRMYDVDEDFWVGSKKGIMELEGDLVGFVGVIKDNDELNVLTDVDSSGSTGEEVISMDGAFFLHLLLDSICLVLISVYLL